MSRSCDLALCARVAREVVVGLVFVGGVLCRRRG